MAAWKANLFLTKNGTKHESINMTTGSHVFTNMLMNNVLDLIYISSQT